jgi:hypothetical protein
VLTFRLNRVLSGSPATLDARPFHATNVALHAGASRLGTRNAHTAS